VKRISEMARLAGGSLSDPQFSTKTILVFSPLLSQISSYSSFPRRRESRDAGTSLPYQIRMDPRLRGDDVSNA